MLYVSTGILLRKQEIKDGQWILHIFTREYGKIQGFAKSSKKDSYDIGQLIEVHIKRANETNTFTQIRTKIPVITEGVGYTPLFAYLQLIACIGNQIPNNAEETGIYDDLVFLLETQHKTKLNEDLLILAELRVMSVIQSTIRHGGHPGQENYEQIIKKLEVLGRNHTLSELMKVRGIPKEALHIVHREYLRNFFPGQ